MSGCCYVFYNLHAPVDQLLHYQECHEDDVSQWPDYPAQFGFTLEHVPDLVRMATDKRFGTVKTSCSTGHPGTRCDRWGSLEPGKRQQR
ncbi:MAG: hypothetical protein HC873_15870 [Leptolyngbyaceae cyanobacterium SL_1_1]|nr:hypothetical protein [Leptolyngbyaceae cyanobacterium SL_1_1]